MHRPLVRKSPPRVAPPALRSHFTPEQQAEIAEMIRASHGTAERPLREALFRGCIAVARVIKPNLPWERLKEKIDG